MTVDLDLPRTWDPASQERAAQLFQKLQAGSNKVWYCRRGRTCDGKPHDGVPYKHARGDQWPPPGSDWDVWLMLSGRGGGKTRSGAEYLRKASERIPRMAMIAPTGPDIRGTLVEGESGLIFCCEQAGIGYTWEPSKKEFTFANGAKVFGFSGEEPDRLRGPQHGLAWVDEACWIDLIEDVWDNLMFGLRLDYGVPGGARVLATSTPRPIKWLKARLAEPNTRLVRVSTYENIDNLDPHFRERIINKYEGTRKGRQELHGEILEDVEGALWNTAMIDNYRFDEDPTDLERIVVALDPAGSKTKRSDETGIIVVGKKGTDFYVLADYSGKYSPAGWAEKARQAFECHQADRIVVERNFGGDLVGSTLENVGANLPVQQVTSRRGKALRAEPVAALYEKGRVHHPRTKNPAYWPDLQTAEESLEEQMCQWVPGDADSPDRLDALVHGLVALAGLSSDSGIAVAPASMSVR